jgi:hypothetical protein
MNFKDFVENILNWIIAQLIKYYSRLFLLIPLLVSGTANAYLQDEIQVYDDEVNARSEYSLELHLNTTPRGNQQQGYPGKFLIIIRELHQS